MYNPLTILSEPAMLHAAIVHFPIVFSVLGLPVVIGALVFQQARTLRLLALILYASAVAASIVSEETGEGARSLLSNTLPVPVWEQLDEHEKLAGMLKFTNGVTAVALLLSMVQFKGWRGAMLLIATCGAAATAVLTATTAHLGGTLVYNYGLGTPASHKGATASGEGERNGDDLPELVPIREIDLAAAKQISFVDDIKPLIDQYCIDCHEGVDADGEYDMSTHEGLFQAGTKAGPGVIPGDPDNSALIQYIRGELQPRMPKREPALSEDIVHTFRSWIKAGAVDDSVVQETLDPLAGAAQRTPAVDPLGAAASEPAPEEPLADPLASAATEAAPEEPKLDPLGAAATEAAPEEPMADPLASAATEAAPEEPTVDPLGAVTTEAVPETPVEKADLPTNDSEEASPVEAPEEPGFNPFAPVETAPPVAVSEDAPVEMVEEIPAVVEEEGAEPAPFDPFG